MKQPILITGPPRSGTSATAGIIHASGAFGGDMRGANRNNPKGQFENRALVNINKGWLVRNGYDMMGQAPVPGPVVSEHDWPSVHESNLLYTEVWNSLVSQGWDGESPWFFKDPKITWNWPLWLSAFPDAYWIIVERNVEDTARSCQKTGFMRAYNSVKSWSNWVNTHYQRLEYLQDHSSRVRVICPVRFIVNGAYEEIRLAVKEFGLQWNDDVNEFIDKRFWHSKRSE